MMPPRGLIFIGLNVVRVLSIIGMLLVFASSVFVMVTDVRAVNAFMSGQVSGNSTSDAVDCDYIGDSTVPNQPAGVFWAIVNRLLIIFQIIFLILSEVEWPLSFFDRFFPVLGSGFGLGALGIFQGLIGATVLSHHVDDFTLVAAFFLFSVGCLNMLLGLIFREGAKSKRSISTWRAEKSGVLPTHAPAPASSFRSSLFGGQKADVSEFGGLARDKSGYGFGRQGEKEAGLKGFILSPPSETLPRYATRPSRPASLHSESSSRPASMGSEETLPPNGGNAPAFRSSPTAL